MSTLTVGDKVKFLNASGGGIVAKVIDSRFVSVMIEDGFEIPTLISELIKIDPKEPAARFFDEHFDVVLPAQPTEAAESGEDRLTDLPAHLATDRTAEELYLAFVPHDQKWLITGHLDVLLVNNSSYDILYNIFSKTPTGHYNGVDYGSIFPDSKIVIATINREQVTTWTDGIMQFLFHKEQCKSLLPPFNSEFKIEGKKFYKEGNYRYHPAIQAKGIVVKVISLTEYFQAETIGIRDSGTGDQAQAKVPSLIEKYQVAPREAVVDLHIHELVDDPANLEKSEILEFQKNFFLKCLDSALASHFIKVVFIHGVGNGVLRTNLIELLKMQKGIEFFDAPMSKFGVGALDVRIPHND